MKKFLIVLLLILAGAGCAYAQENAQRSAQGIAPGSIKELEAQIKRDEEQIRLKTELLNKNKKDQQLSQSQLKLLLSRITDRRKVVNSLDQQITLLADDIDSKNKAIVQLRGQLDTMQAEYAAMVKAAYKNYKLNDFLLFLFASEDFNQATRRVEFMRRYNRMRKEKALQIAAITDSISAEVAGLDVRRTELDGTRKTRTSEIATMAKEEVQYRQSVTQLQSQEKTIQKELKAKRDEIEKAQKQIQQIIAEEQRRNQQQKRTAAEDREIAALSGRFDENKGKLPNPIAGGAIIDRYGTHPHPTQPGLKINNKGVNIAGQRGADVAAVFEGSVTRIFSLPGYNNCVMVRHGDYITLYANMASVSVKNGDKISLGQRLGRIADSSNNDDNFLHFEVWHQTTNLNPEQWLRR